MSDGWQIALVIGAGVFALAGLASAIWIPYRRDLRSGKRAIDRELEERYGVR